MSDATTTQAKQVLVGCCPFVTKHGDDRDAQATFDEASHCHVGFACHETRREEYGSGAVSPDCREAFRCGSDVNAQEQIGRRCLEDALHGLIHERNDRYAGRLSPTSGPATWNRRELRTALSVIARHGSSRGFEPLKAGRRAGAELARSGRGVSG